MKKQIQSRYFEKRAAKRMEDAHRKANRPVAKISRAYNRSKERLEDDIKRILGNVDKLDNTLRKEHLRIFINNEEYQNIDSISNSYRSSCESKTTKATKRKCSRL